MIKKALVLSICTSLTLGSLYSASNTILFDNSKAMHIFVNNRIVANVHGKAISIIDVMKKMDLLFYQKFPQYASSVEARFQFYQINWRHILNEVIEKELILADAEEAKVPMSNGDVRQEMENLFGPNIIANLDKAGLTFEEAWEMVKEELIMKRMTSFRINAKAVRSVTPQSIHNAYLEYAEENRVPDKWCYRVITIRGEDPTNSAETANAILHLLEVEKSPVEQISDKVKDLKLARDKTTVNISDECLHSAKDVSDAYKEILSVLTPNTYSKPVAQKSKTDQSMVFRIFYLKDNVIGKAPSFTEMEQKIKNKLIDLAVQREAEEYMKKLRNHFNVNEKDQANLVPESYQPFALK